MVCSPPTDEVLEVAELEEEDIELLELCSTELTLLLDGAGMGVGVLVEPPPPPQATRSPLAIRQTRSFGLNIRIFSWFSSLFFSPQSA